MESPQLICGICIQINTAADILEYFDVVNGMEHRISWTTHDVATAAISHGGIRFRNVIGEIGYIEAVTWIRGTPVCREHAKQWSKLPSEWKE